MKNSKEVDTYIKSFPENVRGILGKIRKIMQEEVPDYEEVISYGIAALKKDGKPIVYFAGFKNHVSVYPATHEFPELEQYRTGKGTFQFALNKEIPYDLIREFTKFRMKNNEEKVKGGENI
jgi:uncharacterized protein YdhG (YjbR/CyaY superfamily)